MRLPRYLGEVLVAIGFLAFALFPFVAHVFTDVPLLAWVDHNLGQQFIPLFCYGILALGLNVVVGYTGLLNLGIAAFFGIGAYVTGVLTVQMFPFQFAFPVLVVASSAAAALVGVVATAPTLRLRGDYLALVTLGFGLIAVYAIRNFDQITDGTRGLNPIAPKLLPFVDDPDLSQEGDTPGERLPFVHVDWGTKWRAYPYFYWICLGFLGLTMLLLRNLERSRIGRSWIALREDELACSCMGLNPARLKLLAIALGAALAGLAGCLYAINQNTTAGPNAYDFNRSIITLCCLILGGLGNRAGVLLGVLILVGYDTILTPNMDNLVQKHANDWAKQDPDGLLAKLHGWGLLKMSSWRLSIFGLALILMMRFRPHGIWPARPVRHDLP